MSRLVPKVRERSLAVLPGEALDQRGLEVDSVDVVARPPADKQIVAVLKLPDETAAPVSHPCPCAEADVGDEPVLEVVLRTAATGLPDVDD